MQIYKYTLDLLVDKPYDASPKICVVRASSLPKQSCQLIIYAMYALYMCHIYMCVHICVKCIPCCKSTPERLDVHVRWMWGAEWVQLPVLTKNRAYGFLPPWCAWVSERGLHFSEMSFSPHASPGRYFVCHRKLRCLHSH